MEYIYQGWSSGDAFRGSLVAFHGIFFFKIVREICNYFPICVSDSHNSKREELLAGLLSAVQQCQVWYCYTICLEIMSLLL